MATPRLLEVTCETIICYCYIVIAIIIIIANASKLSDFIIYADDTTLSTTIEIVIKETNNKNIESKINMELTGINNWLKANKLSININKCKYMIFHTFRKKENNVKIKMCNTTINRVNEFNCLGLNIDENLSEKIISIKLQIKFQNVWVF